MSVTYASQRNVASKENPPSNQPPTYNTWTRPADWLTLPTVGPTDQKFAGLYAVFNNNANYVALTATTSTGTYTVDWGDGSSPVSYASNVAAEYKYDYATVSSGTLTTRGYKQCIITVTANTGNLTGINLNKKYTNTTGYPALPKYNSNWLDVIVGSPYLTLLTVTPNGSVVSANLLEQFTLVSKSASLTIFTDLFYFCYGLRKVNIDADMSNVTSTSAMFYNCTNLEEAPYFDTSNVTSSTYMFAGCQSLKYVPTYNTSKVTSIQNMFNNCYLLTEIPPIDTANSTSFAFSFSNCYSIQNLPYLNTSKVTNMGSAFLGCRSLINIPTFDTGNVTNLVATFSNCTSLESVPLLNTSKVTTATTTFTNCAGLVTVANLNLSNVTDATSMFSFCAGLESVPNFSLGNLTTAVGMFNGAVSLASVPAFDLPKVTSANSMFATCNSLPTISNINTPNLLYTSSMFSGCTNLTSVPQFDTSKVTIATTMFSGCSNLKSEGLPTFNFANCTQINGMFQSCYALTSVPAFDFSKANSWGALFNGANSLTSIPAYNMSNANAAAASFAATTSSMGNCKATGMKFAIDFSNSLMDKPTLENLFANVLGTPTTAQTLTITNNPGASNVTPKTVTYSSASRDVTMTASGSVNIGDYMYGSPISAIACTFTDATDLVTVTVPSAAPIAGTLVAFATIVTTTGISINTNYYVINPVGKTFQLALTPGGSAISLTTNGTGTVRYALKVTNVVGTTVTLDNYPMNTGTSLAATFRVLNTNLATFRLWTVSG